MTTFTDDIPPDVDAILDRLRQCDGRNSDAAVVCWEHCQAVVAELERLRGQVPRISCGDIVRYAIPVGDENSRLGEGRVVGVNWTTEAYERTTYRIIVQTPENERGRLVIAFGDEVELVRKEGEGQ